VAANFLREMWKCHAGGGETPESRPTSEMVSSLIPKGSWKEEDQCDPAIPVFMDMTARNTMKHLANEVEATVRSDPSGSWKLMEDRPGKFGWIGTRLENRTQTSSLIFSYPSSRQKDRGLTLFKFHYLRTYMNAGKITTYICGVQSDEYDALWLDYETNHVSIPVMATIIFDTNYCGDRTDIDIEFRLKSLVPAQQDQLTNLDRARGEEKFKVIAVKSCSELK